MKAFERGCSIEVVVVVLSRSAVLSLLLLDLARVVILLPRDISACIDRNEVGIGGLSFKSAGRLISLKGVLGGGALHDVLLNDVRLVLSRVEIDLLLLLLELGPGARLGGGLVVGSITCHRGVIELLVLIHADPRLVIWLQVISDGHIILLLLLLLLDLDEVVVFGGLWVKVLHVHRILLSIIPSRPSTLDTRLQDAFVTATQDHLRGIGRVE